MWCCHDSSCWPAYGKEGDQDQCWQYVLSFEWSAPTISAVVPGYTELVIRALIGLTYRWLQVVFTTGGGHWVFILNTALLYGTLLYFVGGYKPCTTADHHPFSRRLMQVRLELHTIAC